jgi:ribosomal protein L37AE/L43A
MNQPPSKSVVCPRCGKKQPDRGPTAIYWCGDCRCQFDNDPDEGGTHSDRDPSARLRREESEREFRKAARQGRKR